MKKIVLLSIALSFFSFAFSQTDTTATDDYLDMDLESLMNVEIVTASKSKQSLAESPAQMIVVTAQMIEDRGYHHLEEILHDLPGFDFDKTFGVNYSTTFMRGYRSDNSDRFILMFDGIIENDIWKQTTWMSRQYPVSQIKQIEVLYGPASALYGTNAFSGIINVITKQGEEVGDVNLVTSAGSWGRKNVEFSSGKQLTDNISYNITAKYFAQDDLHEWDDYNTIDGRDGNFSQSYLNDIGNELRYYVDGRVLKEDFNQDMPGENLGIHANVQIGNLKFTALNWEKKEMESYSYIPMKRSGRWTEWGEHNQGYMLSHEKEINEKISLSSKLSYRKHSLITSREGGNKYYTSPLTDTADVDYEHSQLINPADPTTYQLRPKGSVILDGDTTYYTGKVYTYELSTSELAIEELLSYNLSEKIMLMTGAKLSYINTQEDYAYALLEQDIQPSPRHLKKTIAGYAQAVVKPIEALSITLGGRYENQKNERNEGYDVLIPRLSAVYKLNENLVFRLQYAEAFQEADDWHKFATSSGERPYASPTLEPEKLKSYELGTTAKFGNALLLTGAAYYTQVSNFIESVDNTVENPYHGYTDGEHFENVDGGEVTIYGYELNFNSQITKDLYLNGNVSGAYNYGPADKMEQDADGNFQPVEGDDGEVEQDPNVLIGDIAPIKLNLGLLYNYKNKITFYPKVNYVAPKKTVNWREDLTNPIYRDIDGYAIVSININMKDMFGTVKGLDFNVKISNVMGATYYNPGYRSANGSKYPARVLQPGMNYMVGLKYAIK